MKYSNVRVATSKIGLDWQRLALRQIGPLLIAFGFVWMLSGRLVDIDLGAITHAVSQVRASQWGLAIAATAASFWAVGRYDAVLHRVLNTRTANNSARQSGLIAIAISQFTGFGVITGTLARWRMLPNTTLWQASRITLAVSLSFLAGWAVFTAMVVAITLPGLAISKLAWAVLLAAAILVCLSLWQPRFGPQLPSLRAMMAIFLLAALDTGFAGIALWALLPPEFGITPLVLMPAFLVALGAGLIGGTPGGVGPFEVALISLLPHLPTEPILAAAMSFRLVYYVLPASVAVIFLFRGASAYTDEKQCEFAVLAKDKALSPIVERAIWNAPQADVNLIRQGEIGLLSRDKTPFCAGAITGQSMVAIGDPIEPTYTTPIMQKNLAQIARQTFRNPLFYKCSSRMAVSAKSNGWVVFAIVQEALINPATFTIDGSTHRQLRRKLRKAETAGVKITEGSSNPPLKEMSEIAAQWSRDHDGERGFSMGRFNPQLLLNQRVFLARQNDKAIAFITLHEVAGEWSLDLMRHCTDTPDGTMQLLITYAISRAKELGCPRISLACVPVNNMNAHPAIGWLCRKINKTSGADGLRRFKSSFAPRWQTRYAAAPSYFSLFIGLWDVMRRINRSTRIKA